MKLPAYRAVIFSLSLFISHAVIAESCLYGDARAPVQIYTQAMKEYRFNDAYAVLTSNMTDGLTADAWAAGQRKLFELGQVVIGKLDVRWPQHIDAGSCAQSALVPNVLSAKDRFNNQGSVEFELYRVVKEAGAWKIDAQETLIEEPEIHRWFPGDVIPEFKDQLPSDELLPGEAET
jgi:hypothetical protein